MHSLDMMVVGSTDQALLEDVLALLGEFVLVVERATPVRLPASPRDATVQGHFVRSVSRRDHLCAVRCASQREA
jgi:hypothetical protein